MQSTGSDVSIRMFPFLPIERIESDRYAIPATRLVFVNYFRTDGPVLVPDAEKTIQRRVRYRYEFPGFARVLCDQEALTFILGGTLLHHCRHVTRVQSDQRKAVTVFFQFIQILSRGDRVPGFIPERTDTTVELKEGEVDIDERSVRAEAAPEGEERSCSGGHADRGSAGRGGPSQPTLDMASDRTMCLEWLCPNCGAGQAQVAFKCPECGYDEVSQEGESSAQESSTGKSKVSAAEILADIRAGMDKESLMARHQLSEEDARGIFCKAHPIRGAPNSRNILEEAACPEPQPAHFPKVDRGNVEQLTAQLIRAADDGDLAQVKRLVRRGADVNGRDEEGQTALMWAAMWGYVDVMTELMDQGADVTLETKDGSTALSCASVMKHENARQLLVARGAKG